ncbi:membrane protein of ER body-like protein [Silene latifolia]|uniref:membrane protein of ER body-like protein n=1 Tax=Silene latifolia TaxID=37657 RepID=UPI003D7816F0
MNNINAGEVRVPMLDNQEPLLGHQREDSKVEVIKAVVYGGLLESIASLSIIVSAAGGDATTLNIVALGLANVFGGLLVLANSLMTLKELTGRHYEDQLGQPGHFLMHATIAVISYLVFGLISPLIYGFSFYKSDNKYLKLAALAASSFVCITVLSTGKAYAQRPPKAYLKTVFYYISLTVTVSGIAYVAGNLISILLKNLLVFEPATSMSMLVLEARVVQGPWSCY